MKKVTIAAMAAMVLASGAMASDEAKAYSAAEMEAILMEQTSFLTVGAGFVNTASTGSPAIMLNYAQVNEIVAMSFDFEASKDYLALDAKAKVMPMFNSSYAGIGFINAGGKEKTIAGDGIEILKTQIKQVTSQSVFGIIGFQNSFINMDGVKVGGDIGYRFGEIDGPAASISLSKKFGPDFYSQTLGLKVGFEQIKNSDENINRMAIYGTLTF